MVRECMSKSPMIGIGQSFVTKWGNIRLIAVYDHNSGKIGIKPNGKSEIVRSTEEGIVEDVGYMTVETNFYTLAGGGCYFYVCGPDVTAPPVMCTQTFKIQDQNGNPLNGNVNVGTTNITVLGTGTWSVEKGKTITAIASFSNQPTQSKTFTTCTTTTFTFNVVQDVGTLSITTVPTDASISIDGKSYGVTPNKDIKLPLGIHNVILKKDGYHDVTKEVTLQAGIPGIISVILTKIGPVPDKYIGAISHEFSGDEIKITVQVTNVWTKEICCYIELRDQSGVFIEKTPGDLNVAQLIPGQSKTLTINSHGAVHPTWNVNDVKGQTVSIELKTKATFLDTSFCEVPSKGYEIVDTKTYPIPMPPDAGYIKCQAYDSVSNAGLSATIRIDGTTIVPKTPHTTPALPIGQHTVSFLLEGYSPKTVTVTVKAGETVNAYGSMVKLALADAPGFDININVPGLLPKTSLHVKQVVKVPLTKMWWDSPLGHGMRWDNISNGVFKARARSADSSPTPNFHTGFAGNENYAVYVGTSAVAFFPPGIVYGSTDKVTAVNITGNYIDWVSSKVCAALGISSANCPFFIASSVSDAAFFLELWTIITKHENLAGEHTLPTALDYALFPIAIFGMLSPGISEGKIVQVIGKRITELIPLSRKGTPEIKAVMQDPGIDTFLLRATESQFKDFVRYIDDGLHINAKNLLKTVDDAPLSKNDLHAMQRAANFVEELDPKLIKAGSIESIKKVLTRFSDKFKNIFMHALDFARDNPKTAVGVGILAIWFMIDNVPFYIYMYLKTKGRAPGDRSWQAKLYVDKIDQYKFNVINAEKIQDWDLFCSNIGLMEDAVDTLESYIIANKSTLENEETYAIYEGTVQVYREAIKLKREVHTCAITIPDIIDAEVMEILDSDTVRIKYAGADYTVRLLGINAPEGKNYDYTCTGIRSPFLIRRLVTPGKECIEEETWTGTEEMYNASKVWIGQNLPVHQIARFRSDTARQFDKYGRLLAIPYYNDKNICRESLKAGHSVVFFYDENVRVDKTRFLSSEKIAKDAKLGVWAVEAGLGTIRCVSTPTAAEVWLDGEYTGKKTISSVAYLYNIPVGQHTVEFRKIIDDVSQSCSKTVTVTKDGVVPAECSLVSGVTPTPPPTEKATWQIGDVKNEAGALLSVAKVYVDNIYVKHYAPELLTFCTGCSCDAVVPCGFGSHAVTIKKTGYQDWNKTRTLGSGDTFTDNPVMKLIPTGTFPVTLLSQPTGATIKVDGVTI